MTKTLTLTAALAACHLFGNAQIKKGAVLLGGQVSFYNSNSKNNSTTNEGKSNNGGINISVGKAVKENTIVGVYGAYGKGKIENIASSNSKDVSTSINASAGIFLRKYKRLGKDFYFFGELNAGYASGKQVNESKNGTITTTNTNKEIGGAIGLTPGLSYQICKKLQLEVLMPSFAGLRFGSNKYTQSSGSSSNGNYFQVSSSLNNSLLNSLAVGFRLVL